jgi:proline dehydrogenase
MADPTHPPLFHHSDTEKTEPRPPRPNMRSVPTPLAVLPLAAIVRSLLVTSISSSKLMLPPSLWAMSALAHTKSPLLSPDHNPLLRALIKRTFYAQFCAGESRQEVRRTISALKDVGFTGVVLGYAKEVVLDETGVADLAAAREDAGCVDTQVRPWAEGTMETVVLAQPGDFVALKSVASSRGRLVSQPCIAVPDTV